MSCLNIVSTIIGNIFKATGQVSRNNVSSSVIGNIFQATGISKIQITNASLVGSIVNVSGSVVCVKPPYLIVSPNEVQWITNDIGVFYDVQSNTTWIVE